MHAAVLRKARRIVGPVLVAVGRFGVGLAEHRTVGAEHDGLVLIDVFQVVAQPTVSLVRKSVVVGARVTRIERVVLHDDVIEENKVQIAQFDRIAGRTEVLLELRHRLAVGSHILHVVVVADHVENREVESGDPGAIGRIKRHVVVNQIAQRDAVNRPVGDRRGGLLQIAAHIFVHVDRMERKIVVTRAARTDLRIGRHQDRVTRSRFFPGLKRKIGLDLGRALRNALPELRNAVLHRDFIRCGNGHLHEAPFREVARKRIIARVVGHGRKQSVAHDHPFDGQSPLIDDRPADDRILASGPGSSGRVVAAAGGQEPPDKECK